MSSSATLLHERRADRRPALAEGRDRDRRRSTPGGGLPRSAGASTLPSSGATTRVTWARAARAAEPLVDRLEVARLLEHHEEGVVAGGSDPAIEGGYLVGPTAGSEAAISHGDRVAEPRLGQGVVDVAEIGGSLHEAGPHHRAPLAGPHSRELSDQHHGADAEAGRQVDQATAWGADTTGRWP